MDAFVKRCEHCQEPLSETTRGRPQKFCSDRCRQAHRKTALRTGNGLRYRTGRVKPKSASQGPELSSEFEPENLSTKTNLRFEKVNEVTFKLTDSEETNVSASHGQWGGYRATKAVAWVIKIESDAWLARCGGEALRTIILQRSESKRTCDGERHLWRLLRRKFDYSPQ
jgi:hypothetical protein